VKRSLVGVAFVLGIAPVALAQTPLPEVDQVRARQKISMMESVLESAVANGADSLMRQVRAVMPPDALMMTGAPSARGFRLEGYGVFFDVEVPAFRRTMGWTLRQMVDENGLGAASAVNQLKAYIATVQDPRMRGSLERAMRRLELQVGPVGPVPSDTGARTQTVGTAPVAAQSQPAPDGPMVNLAVIEDPNGVYTHEVSAAIVDAMIENSGPLPIAEGEWLTVAARDNERRDSLAPQDPFEETVTMIYRIKGSDLQAYRANKIDLEEVRRRVKIGQF